MAQNRFYIELDNEIRSFFPGQAITGRAIVEACRERKTDGIQIVFAGGAAVRWTETRTVHTGTGQNQTSRTETIVFSSHEEYFNCVLNLVGHVVLPMGRYSYPFQFVLPPNLPSSFSGLHGSVTYDMTAIMKRTWKFNHKAMVPFTVNAIVDLNRDPRALCPMEVAKDKNICCLCCKSGPVAFLLKLPRTGYVPGEIIEIIVEMLNQSDRKVLRSKLTLSQQTSFHARGKTKLSTQLLVSASGPSIEEGGSESWGGKVLKIPPVPPTQLGNCGIINVEYYLTFEMELSGPSSNLKGVIPIVIGTIPLRNTFHELGFISNQQRLPEPYPNNKVVPTHCMPLPPMNYNQGAPAGPAPLPSAPYFEEYPDLPPPTYAESVALFQGESTANQNSQENTSSGEGGQPPPYVPNYITYGFASPTPQFPIN